MNHKDAKAEVVRTEAVRLLKEGDWELAYTGAREVTMNVGKQIKHSLHPPGTKVAAMMHAIIGEHHTGYNPQAYDADSALIFVDKNIIEKVRQELGGGPLNLETDSKPKKKRTPRDFVRDPLDEFHQTGKGAHLIIKENWRSK